jgi:SAM-dependent methyltransferase
LKPWYEATFNQDYLELYGPVLDTRTPRELAGLQRLCPLAPGSTVLDLCCGQGRHVVELARLGHKVTGVDLSKPLLKRARQRGKGLPIRWLEADMRELKFRAEFDVVVSFYHAFGYFDEEPENERVLRGIVRALKPGGRLFMDLLGSQSIAEQVGERTVDLPDFQLHETVDYQPYTGRLTLLHRLTRPNGGVQNYEHRLRLFTPEDIAARFERVGLQVLGQWGDFDGCPLDQGDRLITLASV